MPNDEGTQISIPMEGAVNDGACLEETWPYQRARVARRWVAGGRTAVQAEPVRVV